MFNRMGFRQPVFVKLMHMLNKLKNPGDLQSAL